MSEFPTNPNRRQRERQQAVAVTIAGMQDILLEVGFIPVEVTDPKQLPSDDPDFEWSVYDREPRLF